MNRRGFIRNGSGLMSSMVLHKSMQPTVIDQTIFKEKTVNFWADGIDLKPNDYAKELFELTSTSRIEADAYGRGKIIEEVETLFAGETGKESCILLPTGTLSNQLAIRVLSGTKNKILVPETSHIYRDEADAAQTIHGKRLVPIATGQGAFTADELEKSIALLKKQEVYPGAIGTLCIENTNRRCYEEVFRIEEMKRIFSFAKSSGISVHLDGARLYIASAYSGVSVKEYAAQADTVYISLYKYFGASAGAVLCGDKRTIDAVRILTKPMGASVYQNWMHAIIALEYHKNFLREYPKVIERGKEFINHINKRSHLFSIKTFPNGSNTVKLFVNSAISVQKFVTKLKNEENISLQPFDNEGGFFPIKINQSLFNQNSESIYDSFEIAANSSKL